MKRAEPMQVVKAPGLAWGNGDFYVPQFASHGRAALVPGAPDVHRLLFLERAAIVELELLAGDTARWYAACPDAQGWEFEGQGIFVGSFPFAIAPLRLEPHYHVPTWRSRGEFKAFVLAEVERAIKDYCDRIEADALAAGSKRAPRKRGVAHFDWLARYQVKGETFASIAETSSQKFAGGRQTVRKAIIELAKYLELNLRPPTL